MTAGPELNYGGLVTQITQHFELLNFNLTHEFTLKQNYRLLPDLRAHIAFQGFVGALSRPIRSTADPRWEPYSGI